MGGSTYEWFFKHVNIYLDKKNMKEKPFLSELPLSLITFLETVVNYTPEIERKRFCLWDRVNQMAASVVHVFWEV